MMRNAQASVYQPRKQLPASSCKHLTWIQPLCRRIIGKQKRKELSKKANGKRKRRGRDSELEDCPNPLILGDSSSGYYYILCRASTRARAQFAAGTRAWFFPVVRSILNSRPAGQMAPSGTSRHCIVGVKSTRPLALWMPCGGSALSGWGTYRFLTNIIKNQNATMFSQITDEF